MSNLRKERKIWLLADTHFGHTRMVEYCGRPVDFEAKFQKSCFRLLQPNDILIHLGDIGIGSDEKMHNKYIKPLPCKKWLVKGNHDRKKTNWYLDNGWDFVCNFFVQTFYGKRILFSHKPMPIDGIKVPTKTDQMAACDLNIHGHFHNSDFRKQEPEFNKVLTDKHRLLAHENAGYEPILLETFIKQI